MAYYTDYNLASKVECPAGVLKLILTNAPLSLPAPEYEGYASNINEGYQLPFNILEIGTFKVGNNNNQSELIYAPTNVDITIQLDTWVYDRWKDLLTELKHNEDFYAWIQIDGNTIFSGIVLPDNAGGEMIGRKIGLTLVDWTSRLKYEDNKTNPLGLNLGAIYSVKYLKHQ